MHKLIIWSKDRACQLHLLLESIYQNCRIFDEIEVIIKTSNDEYNEGYIQLLSSAEYSLMNVKFTREDQAFWRLTNEAAKDAKYVTFATDDTVVFRPIPQNIHYPESNETFSLRLGLNTIQQDIHRGTVQAPLIHYENNDGILSWDVSTRPPHENYGYPFSLDFHVFEGNLLRELLERCSDYSTSNHLEGRLCLHRHRINRILSFEHSVAVNIPCNNLSENTIAGQYHSYTTKELNDAYLSGKRIFLDFENVVGCHQEFPYSFIGVYE